MKVALVCNDTRGGVQPYAALALGLREVGFDVRAICPAHSASLFQENGFTVAEQFGTMDEYVDVSRRAAESGLLEKFHIHLTEMPLKRELWLKQTLDGCDGVDAILGGLGGLVTGPNAAKKLRIPFMQMHLHPMFAPSNSYHGVLAPELCSKFGDVGHAIGHQYSNAILSVMLGKNATERSEFPIFYGFSKLVVPIESDSKTTRIANGYWTMRDSDNWKPTKELEDFLSKSDDVICIGFGSMVSKDPQALYADFLDSIKEVGARAIILTGWNGDVALEKSETVFFAKDIPHHWLFQKVRATIHHGGAGTTGAALMAGKPQLVVPFGMDQPFWANRVFELGTGPKAIPRRKLTKSNIAAALNVMLNDQKMVEAAKKLGAELEAENGVKKTAQQVWSLLH